MSATFPCAVCGTPITRRPPDAKRPRHLTCPRCRYMIYDYPRAAAGLLVVKDDRVLLLERAHAPRIGRLDVPGGFIEAGEPLEAAARRELREETGLTVGRVDALGYYLDRYYLRGFGYFPTINFYWLARWRSGTPRAADEAASAEWIPLARIGRRGSRLAWEHMPRVLHDVRQRLR